MGQLPDQVAFDLAKPWKLRADDGGAALAYVEPGVGSLAVGGIGAVRAELARRWNAHADLLKACELALGFGNILVGSSDEEGRQECLRVLRAAIAKATTTTH